MANAPESPIYESEQFLLLEGLTAIRKRPGMYVGGTDDKALHHLVFEVVDNSIDEAMAGYCDYIEVIVHADESITIHDNGRGIPVAYNQKADMPTLTAAFTKLHFGAKFGTGAYSASGGLHGIGIKAVNALSESLMVEVRRDGAVYRQTFSRGHVTSDIETVGPLEDGQPTGTSVTFKADTTVMQTGEFKFDTLENRFRQMAFLVPGVMIRVVDERTGPLPQEVSFCFEGGAKSYVKWLNRNREQIHDVVAGVGEIPFAYRVDGEDKDGAMLVNFAFQYTDRNDSLELAFANTINNPDGGTHLTGLRTALTRAINTYARKSGYLKEKDGNFTGRHTLDGITAIVSVRHPNPQFESQTKVKLMNPEVSGAVSNVVSEKFGEFLELNPKEGRKIVEKCLTSMRIQEALDKQRELLLGERKSFLTNTTLPGKLADCSDRGANTEIFIVEGDSAGGCFVGSTRVRLATGISKTFEELAQDWLSGITHFGYATNEDGDVKIVPLIEPRLTRRDAVLVEVELDNGETLRCTPDHLFRLRDGSYKAAESLLSGESLMPLNQSKQVQEWWSDQPEHREKIGAARNRSWADPVVRQTTKQGLAQWRSSTSPEEGSVLIRNGHRINALALLNGVLNADHPESAYEPMRKVSAPIALSFDCLCAEHYGGDEAKMIDAARNVNCKVVAVRHLSETADVYDLTVDVYHNFALDSGVFVHNSAKQARDRHFQAILPVFGKIMNIERVNIAKVLDSDKIKMVIMALGTGIREDFDIQKLRYGRVILLSDADVDGAHIRTLMMTFFYRYMTPMITEGRLFIGQPPIFRLEHKKQVQYIYPEANIREDDLLARSLKAYNEPDKVGVQRYKGLGEMNAEQLWDTTMNPATRTLLQITLDDAEIADRTFDMLMGPAVPPRKNFIMSHAKEATLDI